MQRLTTTLVVLLVVAVAMPTIAALVVSAIPALVSLLVAVALLRIALPSARRRR